MNPPGPSVYERFRVEPLGSGRQGVREHWAALAGGTEHGIFGSPAFVETISASIDCDQVLLSTWGSGGALLGVACLGTRRLADRTKVLSPVTGANRSGARGGWLDRTAFSVEQSFGSEALAAALVELCVRQGRSVLAFPYLPADSVLRRAITCNAHDAGMASLWLPSDVEHSLKLTPAWPHFDGVSSHRRRRLAAMLRQAGLRFTFETPRRADQFDRIIDAIERVERRSWKWRDGTPHFLGPSGGMYRRLLRAAGADGLARVGMAWSADRPVAYQIGFVASGTYGSYLSAFAEPDRHLSPGTLLTVELFGRLQADGNALYSFLRGDESYKRGFSTQTRQLGLLLIGRLECMPWTAIVEIGIPRFVDGLRAAGGNALRRHLGWSGSAFRSRLRRALQVACA